MGLPPLQTEEDKIEFAYELFRSHIEAEDWKVIDRLLAVVPMEDSPPSVLLSILTITAMSEVRKRLKCRDGFYDRVYEHLSGKFSRQMAREMLVGLGNNGRPRVTLSPDREGLPPGKIECDECGTIFRPMTDAYKCPTCGAENYPDDGPEIGGPVYDN